MPSIWQYRRKQNGLERKDGMDIGPDLRIRFDDGKAAYHAAPSQESRVVRDVRERLEMAKADAKYLERWLRAYEQ